jgi:hypothetical protein
VIVIKEMVLAGQDQMYLRDRGYWIVVPDHVTVAAAVVAAAAAE